MHNTERLLTGISAGREDPCPFSMLAVHQMSDCYKPPASLYIETDFIAKVGTALVYFRYKLTLSNMVYEDYKIHSEFESTGIKKLIVNAR